MSINQEKRVIAYVNIYSSEELQKMTKGLVETVEEAMASFDNFAGIKVN